MDARLRDEILSILDRANDMTIATIRQDGYPQATTVSYANDGLDIYFGCSEDSQKARNISRNGKVSLTINLPYANWGEIRGISAGGHADPPHGPAGDRAGGTAPAPEIPSRNRGVRLGAASWASRSSRSFRR